MAADLEPLYDPLSPRFRVDPYPDLHRLRRADPVHWSPSGWCWVLTRYRDIQQVLADRRFGIGLDRLMAVPELAAVFAEPYNRIIRTQLLSSDPPAHARLRTVLGQAFSPTRLAALREETARVVDALVGDARRRGGLDLIADFAHPLPFRVICRVLEVPEEGSAPLEGWTHDLMRTTDPTPMTRAETDRANEAARGFRGFFLAKAERAGDGVGDGFFAGLVAARNAGTISEEELVANLILFFCAGHDTTTNLLGNGLLALFRNPGQLRLLREDPSLARGAVDELLRYDTSVTIARRTALEPVEVGGRVVGEGQYVLCLLNAGNRDPEVFPDPDRLDVRRPNVRPLSFGGGIHHCLGATLARIEVEVALCGLLAGLPALRPVSLEPPWRQNVFVRGLESLPAVA